jgi:prepilin-type N-terminal cleavage/methylation domain-containing protein/prepilin-type processing-associated H-X9-DG protein
VSKRRGFTLIELLVVISIIALLMSIMMPALARVKNQAKTIGCRANLKQWGLFFSMYTQDNNGYFESGVGDSTHANHWFSALRPLYKNDHKILCCPTATKPIIDEFGVFAPEWNVFSAWGRYTLERDGAGYAPGPEGDWGSYGINGWVENPAANYKAVYENFDTSNNWRTPNVPRAAYVPLLMDALRFNVFPLDTDAPPTNEDQAWESTQHMRRICIDRHDGGINMAFLDWSVRKVDLKELWTLQWHKRFKTAGPFTRAGGVMEGDWPDWMQPLRDY